MEPIVIPVDMKHVVQRHGGEWELLRFTENGYEVIERWVGNRRSLMRKMEEHGIVPSRKAEETLLLLPEQTKFRDDEPLSKKDR